MNTLNCRRKLGAAWAAAVIAAMGPTAGRSACAQGAVVCANCGTEWTQLANFLELVAQYEKQAELLRYSIKNTTPLQGITPNNSIVDLQAVTNLLKQAKSLSHASANIDAQFSLKFKNYDGYVKLKLNGQSMMAKYQQWSEDTNAATQTALKAAREHSQQIEGAEEVRIQELEAKGRATKGSLEAQHAALALSVELVNQLRKLRQIMLVNMDLAANYGQTEADRRATEEASWKDFTKDRTDLKTSGGEKFSIGGRRFQ